MNAYTTRDRARIRKPDISAIPGLDRGAYLAARERQRRWQAEAEVDWLLKQNGIHAGTVAAVVPTLRQTIGAALVRAGRRLADTPGSGISLDTAPAAGF